ncbi:HK97 gp10 family phage protein [Neobacillus sp. MM2021_6]|uniref:HK97 gp10 family phage protein n=1 Tax=Bacillaceae TaxID=186817 RepID=UPI00140D8E83|nr:MULTISPECIES: HK97 gp10 family phage protein [Bacillaceae]MBO0961444.1 HK97 gp10 family phage protein [Neobacillus sp. MM2021_6]NHC19549.1 HK97 gp10 family phage protein [Bacillus sp. MM2020_4]
MAGIDALAAEIARELNRYSNLVEEDLEASKKEIADDLKDELKQTSPKDTGSYRKGWRVKKVGNTLVVHNKTDYQLTHLLEHGHVKRGGGRVPAKVHIRPAEQRAIENYLDKVEQAIRQ